MGVSDGTDSTDAGAHAAAATDAHARVHGAAAASHTQVGEPRAALSLRGPRSVGTLPDCASSGFGRMLSGTATTYVTPRLKSAHVTTPTHQPATAAGPGPDAHHASRAMARKSSTQRASRARSASQGVFTTLAARD